jgi:hypothetical protein
MSEWRLGDDDEEESLADTTADTSDQSRGADSLADTVADLTHLQENDQTNES